MRLFDISVQHDYLYRYQAVDLRVFEGFRTLCKWSYFLLLGENQYPRVKDSDTLLFRWNRILAKQVGTLGVLPGCRAQKRRS